jgi:hypothetical protein
MKSLNYFRLLFLWKTFRLFKWIQQNIIDCFLNAIFRYTTAYGTQEKAEKSVKEYENSAQLVNVVSNHTIAFFALQAKTTNTRLPLSNPIMQTSWLRRYAPRFHENKSPKLFSNIFSKKKFKKQF